MPVLRAVEAHTDLELRLLGNPQIFRAGNELTGEIGAKPFAVLAYIAAAAPARQARTNLSLIFWADKPDKASRYRLRHVLWSLHRVIGEEHLQADDESCWLAVEDGTWVDVQEFKRGCQALGVEKGHAGVAPEDREALANLVEIYRGDLLDGLDVRDAPLFDEWLLAERERLQLLYLDALWRLAHARIRAGRLAEAESFSSDTRSDTGMSYTEAMLKEGSQG